MRILGVLIKHELADNLTSGRHVLVSIVCVALCVTSVVLMRDDYANRLKRYGLSHDPQGKRSILDWENRPVIAKPPAQLSLIARGTEQVIGQVQGRRGGTETGSASPPLQLLWRGTPPF